MKPLPCMLGLHAGQAQGGTMLFTCPRCRGEFWQRRDYSVVQRQADALIATGEREAALRLVHDALADGHARGTMVTRVWAFLVEVYGAPWVVGLVALIVVLWATGIVLAVTSL